jgi:imidazole glycerol phosphate synthase subunit HisF
VLLASILHYGHHTVSEIKRFLADGGIAVRPEVNA